MLLAFFFQAQNVDNTSTAELLNSHFAVDVLVDILGVEPRQKKMQESDNHLALAACILLRSTA